MSESDTTGVRHGRNQRRIRNFLLQPGLQLQMGIYVITVALLTSAAIAGVLYLTFARILDLLLELTDFRSEVTAILLEYSMAAAFWLVMLMLIFVALNLLISVLITHRLIGPTVAFRRHIEQLCRGNFASRISLRESDAFREVARDLNRLAELMQEGRVSSAAEHRDGPREEEGR